jgi:hypothetical protein
MLSRLVIAIAYGVIAALALLLIGSVVTSLGSGPFDVIGHFLTAYAWIIGLLVALLVFFGGAVLPGVGPRG